MPSPFVYLPGMALSLAELTAACLDGDVIALGEAFVPADLVETRALRAASLAGMLGRTLAATHLSASWVHGVLDLPPARHAVQRAVPRRLHHVIDRRFVYRDRQVPDADLEHHGGVPVTTAPRTVADLARTPTDAHRAALVAWAAHDVGAVEGALEWVRSRPRLPHGRSARTLLEQLRTR